MSEHLLFGYQQILDLYGVPDSIGAMEGNLTHWYYELAEGSKVVFRFHGGLVVG